MAKINEIVINGFKAFPSLQTIELEGKHLLMYGENGSGKSSVYYALHCIFNSYRKQDKGKSISILVILKTLSIVFSRRKIPLTNHMLRLIGSTEEGMYFCLQYLNMVVMVLIGYQSLKHISLIINF